MTTGALRLVIISVAQAIFVIGGLVFSHCEVSVRETPDRVLAP